MSRALPRHSSARSMVSLNYHLSKIIRDVVECLRIGVFIIASFIWRNRKFSLNGNDEIHYDTGIMKCYPTIKIMFLKKIKNKIMFLNYF